MKGKYVQYFQAVFEEENFTRAAKRLGIAQPTLSMAMRKIERNVSAAGYLCDGLSAKRRRLRSICIHI